MPNCPHCNNPIDVKLLKASTVSDIQSLLKKIGDTAELPDKERDFVENIRYRITTYGDRTRITVGQREWLETIAGKITGDQNDLPF